VNPQVRQGLIVAACSIVAVLLGWQLADGKVFSFDFTGFVVALALLLALGAITVRVFRLPADVVLLGAVLFGYIVGNRGFAQLMPAPGLPLLPAEGALLMTGGWWAVASAFERRLPWDKDLLNRLVLLWLVAGTVRLAFDVRSYGFLAVRDFATVYYALFFFISQRMARRAASRRFLTGSLLLGTILLLPGVQLYSEFPRFFLSQLTVQGSPLIYYKGDLAYTFVAVGSFLVFFAATGRHRYWAWPLTAAMFLFVAEGDNRASLLGAVVVMALLLVARRWQYPAVQSVAVGAAISALVVLSVAFNNDWAGKKLHVAVDRVESMVDVQGVMTYSTEESMSKGDNNRFRMVWWRNVALETWRTNPAFGLGFGYDLAKGFVQEYSPDISEEFTTRSPHNIFLTVFGRMGAAGLAVWLALCGVMLVETWRSLRRGADLMTRGLWCGVWVLVISASFGVVLEGPMGAVPFWIMLGLAHATTREIPGGGAKAAAIAPAVDAEVAGTKVGQPGGRAEPQEIAR
jgi:hypothetical protein